ncbi:MAG: ankyrin repeat domain-containing protein [Candidatus Babeliaceae bacterium]|jgi:hypothetical protein
MSKYFFILAYLGSAMHLFSMDNLEKQFFKWAKNGKPDDLETFIDRVDINSRKPGTHETPLIVAAYNGHEQNVKKLLEIPETEVDAQDVFGDTALHNAVNWHYIRHQKTMLRLLGAGIDFSIKNNNRKTAFETLLAQPQIYQKLFNLTREDYRQMVNVFERYLSAESMCYRCCVCGENIDDSTRFQLLCGHNQFHTHCITHMNDAAKCPICDEFNLSLNP